VRAAHHVAAGEDLRVRGLAAVAVPDRRHDAAALVYLDPGFAEPVRRTGPEAEGDDHRIRRHQLLAARHRLGHAPSPLVRLPQPGFDDAYRLGPVVADDLHRL